MVQETTYLDKYHQYHSANVTQQIIYILCDCDIIHLLFWIFQFIYFRYLTSSVVVCVCACECHILPHNVCNQNTGTLFPISLTVYMQPQGPTAEYSESLLATFAKVIHKYFKRPAIIYQHHLSQIYMNITCIRYTSIRTSTLGKTMKHSLTIYYTWYISCKRCHGKYKIRYYKTESERYAQQQVLKIMTTEHCIQSYYS